MGWFDQGCEAVAKGLESIGFVNHCANRRLQCWRTDKVLGRAGQNDELEVGVLFDEQLPEVAAITIGKPQIKDGQIQGQILAAREGGADAVGFRDLLHLGKAFHHGAQKVQENRLVFHHQAVHSSAVLLFGTSSCLRSDYVF